MELTPRLVSQTELKSPVPAASKSTRHNSQGKAVTLRNYHVAVAINLAATTGDCWLLKLFVEAYGEGHIRLCFQNFQKDATRGCWSRPALDTCKEAFVALHSSGVDATSPAAGSSHIIQPEANAAQADTTADANLARQLHQQELYELCQRSRPKRERKQVYISLLSDDEDIAPPLAKKQKHDDDSDDDSDDEEWLPKELPEE